MVAIEDQIGRSINSLGTLWQLEKRPVTLGGSGSHGMFLPSQSAPVLLICGWLHTISPEAPTGPPAATFLPRAGRVGAWSGRVPRDQGDQRCQSRSVHFQISGCRWSKVSHKAYTVRTMWRSFFVLTVPSSLCSNIPQLWHKLSPLGAQNSRTLEKVRSEQQMQVLLLFFSIIFLFALKNWPNQIYANWKQKKIPKGF